MTTTFQGFSILDPPSPTGDKGWQASPTQWQIVNQNDSAMLVYSRPATVDDVAHGDATPQDVLARVIVKEPIAGIVTWYCRWLSIFEDYGQNTETEKSIQYSTGLTTTDTKSFGMTLGFAEEVAVGAIKDALNLAFSFSSEHSVSMSQSKSVSTTFKVKPQSTIQVWQLQSAYVTEFVTKDGVKHSETVMDASEEAPLQSLTYPTNPAGQTSSSQSADASGANGASVADSSSSGSSSPGADDSAVADNSPNGSSGGDSSATANAPDSGASDAVGSSVADNLPGTSSPDLSSSGSAADGSSSGNSSAVADNSASSTSSSDSGSSSGDGSSVADNAPSDTSSHDAAVPA